MNRVTLTVDGRQIQAEAGRMILPAALESGVQVPHYCFHPGLSAAGNCRMCLVEIEGVPKLQTACTTPVKDGLVVRTGSDRVRSAVRHVMEFLLANHPVDCPVCDQAGECGLQEYYMAYGQYDARFAEAKVTKAKKATPIGDRVMLDQERCILCSRCVRFCREVAKTGDMAIFHRGGHACVDVYPGGWLRGRYTGNLVDVCPVGALTCRDFRFKCRVWYLRKAPSICAGCSRGCAVEIHHNPDRPQHGGGRRVMRVKPRVDMGVNGWWICDDGRYGYSFIDEARETTHTTRDAGVRKPVTSREATDTLAQWLKSAGAGRCVYVASADASNEDVFAAERFWRNALGMPFILPDAGMRTGDGDGLLIREDKHPNSRGVAEIAGLNQEDTLSWEDVAKALEERNPPLLLVNRHDLPGPILERAVRPGRRLVWMGTNRCPTSEAAHMVIPLAVHAEHTGSFTSFDGRLRRFQAAFPPLVDAGPEWAVVSRLSEKMGRPMDFLSSAAVFRELCERNPFYAEAAGPIEKRGGP